MDTHETAFGRYRIVCDRRRRPLSFWILTPTGQADRCLSLFYRYLLQRYAKSTAQAYMQAVLRYVTWLDAECKSWDETSELVRAHSEMYLNSQLHCRTREHEQGFLMLAQTHENTSEITIFLAALRQLYTYAIKEGIYAFSHPLQKTVAAPLPDVNSPPPMPQCSGVQEPKHKRERLTQTYFVLTGKNWIPKIIDDATFPTRIFQAGTEAGWKLRERLVTRILFETGARVSEVCGLTLGDWHGRGLRCSASIFSKGSFQRRVKDLRFSESTAKLLRQYFDHDRRTHDKRNWRLADYLRNTDLNAQYDVPIFLTKLQTPLSPSTYRDLYWRPACKAKGLRVNVHQTRHWFVTSSIREIHQSSTLGPELDARLQELILYMAWRNGRVTLASYNHYFDQLKFAAVQAGLHRKLDESLENLRHGTGISSTSPLAPNAIPVANLQLEPDPDWDFLKRLGGD